MLDRYTDAAEKRLDDEKVRTRWNKLITFLKATAVSMEYTNDIQNDNSRDSGKLPDHAETNG